MLAARESELVPRGDTSVRRPTDGPRSSGLRSARRARERARAEAEDKDALARGLQGFEVSVARRLNTALMRAGKLFAHRYHARHLKTPREVRNALRYVLLNRKHHAAEQRFSKYWIDPWSSAAWFGGWAQPVRGDEPWKRELLALDAPTAKATVWLLTDGWKRHGLLRFDERPG